jgi:hypothetical protein
MTHESPQSVGKGPVQTGRRPPRLKAIGIVIAAAVLLILMQLVYVFLIEPRMETSSPAGPAYNPIGLNTTRQGNGDWTINVTSGGGFKPADVLMQVTNNSTGMMALQARLNKINASDGIFTDNNRNGRIDSGDTLFLRDTDIVDPGMKVQFIYHESSVGRVKELPA